MLFQATLLVDLTAMAICLWMAFYLFARGFPSKITMRGTVLLLALSAFFFGAYNNLFEQIPGTAALRATFLIVGIGAWHDITLHLLPQNVRRRHLPWTTGIYVLGFITILLLINTRNAFVGEQGNILYVAHMGVNLPYILYGVFEIAALAGILYNLLAHDKVGLTPEGRYFLFATFFAVAGVGYGILALAISPPMPRIIQDLMVFSGVFMIGLSVARHQSLVERRTTLQDFPITSLTILLLALAYALTALRLGLPLRLIGPLAAFVVLTHALYDLVREFLERLRIRNESKFRKQLRLLENESSTENTLRLRLQEGLDLLCSTLDASSGFIAIKRGDEFVVTASRQSVQMDRRFSSSIVSYEDISHTQNEQIPNIVCFAPSFDGQTQIAVVGIGKPKSRLDYSHGDLDLLSEVADQIGTIVSLSNLQPQLHQILTQSEINESEANLITDEMIDAMGINPDQEFVKIVEEGLRHLSDYITLGQSPLADRLEVKAGSHIERGRELQKILIESIELLRPAEKRPPEPLPRVWYNHAVLHDAYVEGVPNREIMARLYISEGTFNRTRRNAIRGFARLLMEKNPLVK
ncbi:MAG TPA: hypothetical protein VFI68_06050 [Anaerolineales bacterium]|nr:hypothetical protein [Anaerolineales bacterium]